ncbi:MAG TPA: hypothetical protein EYO33_13425 [Phycisphaerales bacterium]|nr:hypothetical protein [Phycisphaerales bacterium]
MVHQIRKLHILAGLQSLLAMLLFGLTGLCATYLHSPYFTPPGEHRFTLPLELKARDTDRQLVDKVFRELKIPLAPWPPDWSIKSQPNGDVKFNVRTPQTLTRITILKAQGQAEVLQRPLSLAERVVILHEITWNRPLSEASTAGFLWSLYIEFSLWCLIFFVLSGLVLWSQSPPRRKKLGLPFFLAGWLTFLAILGAMR